MGNAIIFILISIAWGGSFVAIQYMLHDVSPLVAATLRVAIAWIVFEVIRRIGRIPVALAAGDRRWVWITALFAQALPFALLFWGEQSISAGLAGILNGTVPLWTFVIGAIVMPQLEPWSLRRAAGLCVGLTGLALVFWPLVMNADGIGTLAGGLAVWAMAVSYAIGTVMNRHILSRRKIPLAATLYQQQIASVVWLCLITLLVEVIPGRAALHLTITSSLAALYLGVCSTALAWIGFYYLITQLGAVRTVAITYFVPLYALLFDLLIFRHIPHRIQLIGAAIVCSAILLLRVPTAKPPILTS